VVGAGLDVHIREEELHVYSGQSRVLSIARGGFGYDACIHSKFLVDISLPGSKNNSRDYRYFPVTREFVGEYLRQLKQIVTHAAKHGKDEGYAEHQMIRASIGTGSPMVLVDRQVQTHEHPGRADMVGLMPLAPGWDKGRLMLVELKEGQNSTIPKAAEQIHAYFGVLTSSGKLREEVRKSYQDVVEQKLRLKVLPDWMRFPKELEEVGCLVVLHGYNQKSVLADRLRASIRGAHPPTWLVLLPEWKYDLPAFDKWEEL
jgi:hypothetical protein